MSEIKYKIEFMEKFEVKPNEKLIGLISDTHIPTRAKNIPEKVFEIFRNVDLILHAGDWVSIKVLGELEKIAKVIGVRGNMDWDEIRLPKINYVKVFKWKIGLTHDAGIFGTEKMKRIANENNFDVLVFGHTHNQFLMKDENGRIYVNPGSVTNPLPPFVVKPSVALLKVSRDKINVTFISLK
jgi:hypothetical protein